MRILPVLTLLVLSASVSVAQDHNQQKLCDAASASTVDHDAGVIVQKVTLSGKWGRVDATVYLPDKEIAEGGVVFSHSSIQADGAATDLLPFALTLARSGAAVIVPERSLLWPPTDRATNREGAVVVCAERWLVDHTKVFNNGEPTINAQNIVMRTGYAYVGPRLCDPAVPSDCHLMEPFISEACDLKHYCRESVWIPVGETEGGDNTRRIISDGGSKSARWLQRRLGLAPITALVTASSSSGSR
jgi:hypothetical protein